MTKAMADEGGGERLGPGHLGREPVAAATAHRRQPPTVEAGDGGGGRDTGGEDGDGGDGGDGSGSEAGCDGGGGGERSAQVISSLLSSLPASHALRRLWCKPIEQRGREAGCGERHSRMGRSPSRRRPLRDGAAG